MKYLTKTVALIFLCFLLAAWGSKGHKKISQYFADALPSGMSFFKPAWTTFVMNHASDADYRKEQDPNEAPRHYIDIDVYPVFVQTGRIPQTYDSMVTQYGYYFVINNGILPWSTITTFDSLQRCFERGDWDRSAYFAADLSHYVGDGHMPLHITQNYNGEMTGQTGIHSRYETTLIGKYESQIVYTPAPAVYIDNVPEYVFGYLYNNYQYVDSILYADTYAYTLSGSTGSTEYYQLLWQKAGPFTLRLMSNASTALASLIYTAWVRAGSPMMSPYGVDEAGLSVQPGLLPSFPNPAVQIVSFPFFLPRGGMKVTLSVYDGLGDLKGTVLDAVMEEGYNKATWDVGGLPPGTYLCRLTAGNYSATRKFVVVR